MSLYSNLFSDYTALEPDKVVALLQTATKGLQDNEVIKRRTQYGWNQITSKKRSWYRILLEQVMSPFIYVLLGVAILSFFFENNIEGGVVILIVLLNTLFGFYQEYKAEKTAQLLKSYLASKVKVVRNGIEVDLLTKELVPGDVIVLYPGDKIPADVRIIWAQSLVIDESALTGESLAVAKDPNPLSQTVQEFFQASNIGFSGTSVISGKALAVVFATGNNSSLGRLATLSEQSTRNTVFSKIITKFSAFILYSMLISLAVIVIVHFLVKGSQVNVIELLLFASALAVSVIPEALPLVMTFALSQGAHKLAQQKTVVKRLSAIEDLGNIEILCTDKTGTLTENVLEVAAVYADKPPQAVFYGMLAGFVPAGKHLSMDKGFDTALFHALSPEQQQEIHSYHKVSEIPFDSVRLRVIALVRKDDHYTLVVRGAYEAVIENCKNISEQNKRSLEHWIIEQGKEGNRTLAIAIKPLEGAVHDITHKHFESDLVFQGLISFKDPLKKTAAQAVIKARSLGLDLKILSGDSKEVCGAVAQQLGIMSDAGQVMTGAEFAQKSLQEKKEIVHKYHVYARVLPEHKSEIIKLLQMDHDVGYLGDGINDVLALKEAHVGLAVHDSVDIARDAADIILLKKSLMVIVDGIEEGRKVFANTLKYLRITLATSFGNFYSLGIAALFLDFLPMLPVQILLVNFLSDAPLVTIATDTVDQGELERPEKYDIKGLLILVIVLGVISTLFDFVFFAKFFHVPARMLQTSWFVFSGLTELVFIISIRTRNFFLTSGMPSLPLSLIMLVVALALFMMPYMQWSQYLFGLTPLPTTYFLWITALVAAYFCVTEMVKLIYYRMYTNRAGKRT